MSHKVDSALYWSVIRKKKELLDENARLRARLHGGPPTTHIVIKGVEQRLDLSDGKFYSLESFRSVYGSSSAKLWNESGRVLEHIMSTLDMTE
jgi:hypothetical protein